MKKNYDSPACLVESVEMQQMIAVSVTNLYNQNSDSDAMDKGAVDNVWDVSEDDSW